MITILDVAKARGLKENEDGGFNSDEIHKLGLPIFGGCQSCQASIAFYNMYPTKTGYVACKDCVGTRGFETVKEFEEFYDTRSDI